MQVQVWNDNIYPYRENFKGQKIEIPPKKYILMDSEEANLFKGTFSPIIPDADGKPTVECYKMIRIEKHEEGSEPEVIVDPLKCNACAYGAASDIDLKEHVKANHEIFVDEVAEKELSKRKVKKGKRNRRK